MTTPPPAGIAEADWQTWPAGARAVILALQEEILTLRKENEELLARFTAVATELSTLRERQGRSSRNSSMPPSSDGPGFRPPQRRKPSGRKRGGQKGHPGHGPELLPVERCDEVFDHHPDACRRCGTLLQGEDPEPLRHQVIEIPPITPLVTEYRLHRRVCPCCSTSTCATLPPEVERSRYGPRLSSLVALLGTAFPLSFGHTQTLLHRVFGIDLCRGSIAGILQRVSAALETVTTEAHQAGQQQPVVYVDETGAPTGNADGNNPEKSRGWLWVMVTPVVTVFLQTLTRSASAAIELLGHGFAGVVVSDRYSGYNHVPTERRQLCWAHLIRNITAIAERTGASGEIGAELLNLQKQLFEQWYRWKDGEIDRHQLQQGCWPLRVAFEQVLHRAVELGCQPREQTPWGKTVRTCLRVMKAKEALWTFLEIEGVEPTNNAAERALRPAVIQRKISHGVQSSKGALCRSRLLTVTTSLRQQGRDVWAFLEQAWIAHHNGGEMPSLLQDRGSP